MLYGGSQAKRHLQPSEEKRGKGKGSTSVHDFPQFTAEAIGAKKALLTERLRRKKKNTTTFIMNSQNRYMPFDV